MVLSPWALYMYDKFPRCFMSCHQEWTPQDDRCICFSAKLGWESQYWYMIVLRSFAKLVCFSPPYVVIDLLLSPSPLLKTSWIFTYPLQVFVWFLWLLKSSDRNVLSRNNAVILRKKEKKRRIRTESRLFQKWLQLICLDLISTFLELY